MNVESKNTFVGALQMLLDSNAIYTLIIDQFQQSKHVNVEKTRATYKHLHNNNLLKYFVKHLVVVECQNNSFQGQIFQSKDECAVRRT